MESIVSGDGGSGSGGAHVCVDTAGDEPATLRITNIKVSPRFSLSLPIDVRSNRSFDSTQMGNQKSNNTETQ